MTAKTGWRLILRRSSPSWRRSQTVRRHFGDELTPPKSGESSPSIGCDDSSELARRMRRPRRHPERLVPLSRTFKPSPRYRDMDLGCALRSRARWPVEIASYDRRSLSTFPARPWSPLFSIGNGGDRLSPCRTFHRKGDSKRHLLGGACAGWPH